VWDALARELDEIMGRRGLRWRSREVHSAPAVFCAPPCRTWWPAASATLPPRSDAPPVIFSRAGHDGMSLGAVTDVGMLFLRNPDGISHHPDESVSAGDVAHGIRALAEAVLLRGTERGVTPAPRSGCTAVQRACHLRAGAEASGQRRGS
jgi:allantoate deiminase